MKKNLTTLTSVVTAMLGLLIAVPAFALTVSPAKIEVTGDPGSTLVGTIDLKNEQTKNEMLYVSYENFEPSDDSGTPKFVGADGGLATWIKSSVDSIELTPGQEAEIKYTITIPTDAEPGGYFAAVFFGNQPPTSEGGQVSIGGRLGILVLLRVDGDIPEAGGITEFGTDGFIYANSPVTFNYRFSNTGGDRATPKGEIMVKNLFGMKVATLVANEIKGTVLPSSSRKFTSVWGSDDAPQGFFGAIGYQLANFHVGPYFADMTLGWGSQNQTATSTAMFIMFPWQLLLVVLIVLAVVFFGGRMMMSGYKKKLVAELQKQVQAQADSKTESK